MFKKIALFFIIVIASFLSIMILIISHPLGKQKFIDTLTDIASSKTGQEIYIKNVTFDTNGNIFIEKLNIDNKFLQVRNLTGQINFLKLIYGNLVLSNLEAQNINIDFNNYVPIKDGSGKKINFDFARIEAPFKVDKFNLKNINLSFEKENYQLTVTGELDLIKFQNKINIHSNNINDDGKLDYVISSFYNKDKNLNFNFKFNENKIGIFTKIFPYLEKNSGNLEFVLLKKNSFNIFDIKNFVIENAQDKITTSAVIAVNKNQDEIIIEKLLSNFNDGKITMSGFYRKDKSYLQANLEKIPAKFFHFIKQEGVIDGKLIYSGLNDHGKTDFSLAYNQNTRLPKINLKLSANNFKQDVTGNVQLFEEEKQFGNADFYFPLKANNDKNSNINFVINLAIFEKLFLNDKQKIKGKLEGDLVLSEKLKFYGKINVKDAAYIDHGLDISLNAINLKTQIDKDGYFNIIELKALSGDGKISASGFKKGNNYQGKFNVQKFPTNIIKSYFPSLKPGKIEVTGDINSIGTSNLKAKLYGDYKFIDANNLKLASLTLDANLKENKWQINSAVTANNKTYSTCSFLVDKEYNIDNKCKLKLASIASFLELEKMSLDGDLDTNFSFNNKNKIINGSMELNKGKYIFYDTATSLKNIKLKAIAKNNNIIIDNFTATDNDKGKITAKAQAAIKDKIISYKLSSNLNKFTSINRQDIKGSVNGNIILQGNDLDSKLEGKLDFERLEINLQDDNYDLAELNIVRSQDARNFKKHFLITNIEFDAKKKIFLRGSGIDAELAGNVNYINNKKFSGFNGELKVLRGYYDFLGKRFDISDGNVILNGDKILLDIKAKYERNDVNAIVNLNGYTDKININLTSNPALPQDEIVSRILFGTTRQKISPMQAFQLANILNKLSGKKTLGTNLDIVGKTRKIFGVDNLKFDSDEANNTTIGAGKYLSDKIYLEVEQNATTQGTKAKVEWQFKPNFTIDSSSGTGQTGKSAGSVGINWKYDY